MNRMKSQVVFEQVLLFIISVSIFLSTYSFFNMYQNSFSTRMRDIYIDLVGEKILLGIIDICKTGMNTNTTIIINIPDKILGKTYKVSLDNNQLEIDISGYKKTYKLYGFEDDFEFSGNTQSSGKIILIYKKGNSIILK